MEKLKSNDVIATDSVRESLLKLIGSMFVVHGKNKIGRIENATTIPVEKRVSNGLLKSPSYEQVTVVNSVVFSMVNDIGKLTQYEYNRNGVFDFSLFLSDLLPAYIKDYERLKYQQEIFDKYKVD